MEASLIIAAASLIPWKKVLENGPQLVSSAKRLAANIADLFSNKTKNAGDPSIAELNARIIELEKLEKEQSELIAGIAEQLELCILNIEKGRKRQRTVFAFSIGACVVSITSLLYILLK